jgi:hypothetical protein
MTQQLAQASILDDWAQGRHDGRAQAKVTILIGTMIVAVTSHIVYLLRIHMGICGII